jgi:hypothetical protein
VHHVHQEKGVLALKIGPFSITRLRKTPAGLTIYPWQALTEDRVSPELRQIVAKVARSEAKSHLAVLTERLQEDERAREFIKRELARAEADTFPVDQDTLKALHRVLDRLCEASLNHEALYGKKSA